MVVLSSAISVTVQLEMVALLPLLFEAVDCSEGARCKLDAPRIASLPSVTWKACSIIPSTVAAQHAFFSHRTRPACPVSPASPGLIICETPLSVSCVKVLFKQVNTLNGVGRWDVNVSVG